MVERIREKVSEASDVCGLCGHAGLVVERSRNRRKGLAWLNPAWDPAERTYRVCPACHARHRLIDGHPI